MQLSTAEVARVRGSEARQEGETPAARVLKLTSPVTVQTSAVIFRAVSMALGEDLQPEDGAGQAGERKTLHVTAVNEDGSVELGAGIAIYPQGHASNGAVLSGKNGARLFVRAAEGISFSTAFDAQPQDLKVGDRITVASNGDTGDRRFQR